MTRQEIVIAIVLSFDTFRAPGNKLLDLPSVTLLLLREFYNVSFFFLSFFLSFFLPFLSFLSFFFLVIIVINPPVRAKPQIGVSLFLYPCREIHGAPFSREFLSISERSIIYIYIYIQLNLCAVSLSRANVAWIQSNRVYPGETVAKKARSIASRYRFPSPFRNEWETRAIVNAARE